MKKMLFPKLVGTAILSALITTASVIPAFAAIDEESVSKVISNPLELRINVNELISSDLISLSWAEGDQEAKEINTRKNKVETVTVTAAPGADIGELGEPIKFGVVVQVPTEDANKIGRLTVDEEEASIIKSPDGNYTYYVIKDGLEMTDDSGTEEASFDISFVSLTKERSISANILAVKEQGVESIPTEAPVVSVVDFVYNSDDMAGFIGIEIEPQEDLNNGTLVITLPEENRILGGVYGKVEPDTPLTEDMIGQDGRTVTIPNITATTDDKINVSLEYSDGQPLFIDLQIDADGDGTGRSMSPKVMLTFPPFLEPR
ncbi:hypothetical protein [Ammoniphilus resinae]|uniref:Uncharacterized protein n=1 Tax=Ammoniphilus resinae TaxID=861532 RepID=A0ABS4GJ61_9BACL|nr:hypothetical protein [Ammoniphilus resinae]MBP1930192.1 hypothetical protein [Ammoniphilus resinae]